VSSFCHVTPSVLANTTPVQCLISRKKEGRLVDINLLALPIQRKKMKFSFLIAAFVGLVLGLSATAGHNRSFERRV